MPLHGRAAGIAVILLLVVLPLGTPARASEAEIDLNDWIRGPIRYIIEKDEAKLYRRLESDAQRALFIERFWARRDPTPETLTNEQRQMFWERVQHANTQFTDSSGPGWMTDRGKVYVLYGPPNEIQEDTNLETKAVDRPNAGHGLIRWIYQGRPSGRMDLDPVVVVPFVRENTGEYRITYDPALSSVFFDALEIREGRGRRMGPLPPGLEAPARRSPLSVMLDLGKMQEVPPQEHVLLERVETAESYKTSDLPARADRFWHVEEAGCLVVLTFDVAGVSEGVTPAVIARFTPRDATRSPRLLGEGSFKAVETVDGARLAQGRLVLEPGEYDLTVMVADPTTAETSIDRRAVTVPGPPRLLRLSDVIHARSLSPVEFVALTSWDEPFLLGPFRVIPRLSATYRRGEPVRLFYAVEGGKPPYRIGYQLEGVEKDGRWLALGEPSVTEVGAAEQAWELQTTESWPLGAYRVVIEVQDAAERLATGQVPFTLTGEGE